MRLRKFSTAIEALLLGGPITYIAILFLPLYLLAPFMKAIPLDWEGMFLFVLSAGTFLALNEYWRLAYTTVVGEHYRFGLLFWVAIFGAVGAMYLFFELELFRVPFFLLSAVAIVIATSHFIYLQAKWGNSLCPTRHSSGTA